MPTSRTPQRPPAKAVRPKPNRHCKPPAPTGNPVLVKLESLTRAVRDLGKLIKASHQAKDLATKQDLATTESKIMSKITEFADSVSTAFDEIGTASEETVTALKGVTDSLAGVSGDVKSLKETIDKLQNTPGVPGPEDQAALDNIQNRVNTLVAKVQAARDATKGAADAAAALDALTENVPTPENPTPSGGNTPEQPSPV